MAVSPACIAAVREASGQKLDDQQATDLIRSMEDQRKALEAKGSIDNLSARLLGLAAEGAEQARIAAALRAKQAALTAIAFDRTLTHIRGLREQGLSWHGAVLASLEGTVRNIEGGRASVAATAAAYQGRYLEPVNRLLLGDPEVAKRLRHPDFARAVTIEMGELRQGGAPGSTGDPAALRLAKAYEQAAEQARIDLNRHGAPIGRLDGWRPQAHDSGRVVQVSPEDWMAFISPLLDRDRTFVGMSHELARLHLRDIYDRITTGVDRNGLAAERAGRLGPANLASTLAAARVLHFKDTNAWLTYAERFGSGDIHAAMFGHLQSAARFAAQLELFGANPEATFTRLLATVQREVMTDPRLTPKERQREVARLRPDGMFTSIGSAWAQVVGLDNSQAHSLLGQIGTGARAVQILAKLGGALMSSMGDLATRAIALSYQGQPALGLWRDNLTELARGRGRGDLRQIAAVLDAGLDGMRDHIVMAGVAEDAPVGWAHRWTSRIFRWQGLSLWSDAIKAGSARMVSRWMGENSSASYSSLPPQYRRVLRQHGIGTAEWDAMRAAAWTADDGRIYVTPDRVRSLTAAQLAPLAKPELEAIQTGLAERIQRRAEADATEAQWVTKRSVAFAERLRRSRDWWEKVSVAAEGGRARHVERLRANMAELETQLSEIAEFHSALLDGRAVPDATPDPPQQGSRGTFRPRTEAYLDGPQVEPALRAARAEGRLQARLDRLRRLIGETNREAAAADIERIEGFDEAWRRRAAELTEFTLRMEARAKARADATAAENADWTNRVQRVFDDTRRRLEIQMRRFFADETRFAFIEADAASRRLTLLNSAAGQGTIIGELLRTLMQFKGYPIAFTQRVLGRAFYGFGEPGAPRTLSDRLSQIGHIGNTFALLTFFGYLSMSLKDMALGYGPRDPTDYKTLLAAMMQGGGAGIYGDYLFAEASRFGGGPLETAAGPTAGAVTKAVLLFQAARDGDARAGSALSLALQNTPMLSLWYVRPAADYLILNTLREAASPGTLARRDRKRFEDYGQERWMPATVWE
jgi:hypothetical protein